MKVAKQKVQVKIDGNVQTKQFGIVFDRHMVNILSNQLYEDKVLAIVRELSTNALDSQIDAGFEGQFEVHLPNWDDMNFWIRDYGTGMSPDKVDNIYRNYGASDRNESNDFTGCMGLGSKTPFCYHTKTFTVDSWFDGTHYQYACFLNEDGMPEIALMCEEASDEPSGVKVTLPCKRGDQYEFENAAESVYRFFKQSPIIHGRSVSIEKPNYTLEDGNWKYDENESYGMRVVMGNVSYRVSETALGDLTPAQRKVVNTGFHVYVDIGDVGVTASREGLDYTNRTKTHIRSYINNIITSFNDMAQDDISACKNLWEARLRFVDYERDSLRGIFDSSKIEYNGTVLFTEDNYIDFEKLVKEGRLEVYCYEYNSYRRKPDRRKIRGIRLTSKKPRLYHNDLQIGGFVRAEAECRRHQTNIILIKFLEDAVDDQGNALTVESAKQEFYAMLGLDESYLTKISTIPSPTVRSSGGSRGKTTKVMEYKRGRDWNLKSNYWENADVDMDSGGLYIEWNRFQVKWDGQDYSHHPSKINRIISLLEDIGVTVPEVYGVKSIHLKKFKANAEWQDFYEWAKEQILAKAGDQDLFSKEFYKNALDNIGGRGYYSRGRLDLNTIHQIAKHCDENTTLAQFSKTVQEVEELARGWEKMKPLRNACSFFGIDINQQPTVDYGLKSKEDNIYTKYPLIGLVGNNSTKCLDHVGLYVNAVDNI